MSRMKQGQGQTEESVDVAGEVGYDSVSLLRVKVVCLVTYGDYLVDVVSRSRGEHLHKRERKRRRPLVQGEQFTSIL